MEDETVKEEVESHPLDEDDAGVDEAVDMDAAVDTKEEEEESMEEDESSKTDVGFGSGAPFGSGTWGVGAATSFGFSKPTEASTGSGSFLNIKPPGSSTAPHVFSFGATSSITLPTPSLPVPATASPFGAFGSSSVTSFGTFGAAPPASMSALPLFGSTAFASTSTSLEAADEGAEEMEDGEGDMDAEA